MTTNMKAFFEAAKADPDLCAKLAKMGMEEVIAAAKEKGIELAEEDFENPAGEVGDEELENVAGGDWSFCLVGGSGEGVDDKSGEDYSCFCVFYGQGSTEPNCVCPVVGVGLD